MMKKNVCRIMVLVAIASIPLLARCSNNAKNSKEPRGFSEVNEELKTAPCGFKYKIVEIEGKRFIAYQSSNWYWEVTRLDD
jgi:hypothetical protein